MLTQEIPRNEWNEFFNRFSRQHQGWLITLEVFNPDFGAQEEVRDLPLEGIAIAENDNAGAIAISAGKSADDHLTHTVIAPLHVWIEKTPQGADAALEIESKDDTKTLLRFRSAVPPEVVDGVVLD